MQYPPVNIYDSSGSGSYIDHAINVDKQNYIVQWEPMMNTAATQTLMSGPDMVACLSYDLSGSSQTIPFYTWVKRSGGFGTEASDWKGTVGPYRWSVPTSWTWINSTAPTYPNFGDYQDNMTSSLGIPLLTRNHPQNINFSRPMFYYFGLRPGKTAFNIFVMKYIDEDFNEGVI